MLAFKSSEIGFACLDGFSEDNCCAINFPSSAVALWFYQRPFGTNVINDP